MQHPERLSMALGGLGVNEAEEEAYRALLTHGPMTEHDLGRALDRSGRRFKETVASLGAKGLVGKSAHRSPLLVAAPPSSAVESLISQRERELRKARDSAQAVVREFQSLTGALEPTEIVQLISGRDATVEWVTTLQAQAEHEVLIFDQPPYVAGGGQNQLELELLKRGVAYRVIYDRKALEHPGQLDLLREITEAGEQARIIDELPSGLAIRDRTLAIMPLRQPAPGREPQRLLIRPSPLLGCLVALFERYWELSSPVRFSGGQAQSAPEDLPLLSKDESDLLVLLAADLKDEAIGRQLGIARRSVQRRIRGLMGRAAAKSRLELLLRAAREGWI